MDMQLALQRCALDDTGEALKLAKSELTGEYNALMGYFLEKIPQLTTWNITGSLKKVVGELLSKN